MNVSIDAEELIVDAEIRQSEFQKTRNRTSQTLTISANGGEFIFINFSSPEALSSFCKKHNFPVEDKRNAN